MSHRAVALAARVGTLLVWVGEAGVRLYASGQPGGARSDRLLYQAKLALDEKARLRVVRKMYELRFGEKPPERRSVEQLRGIEGVRLACRDLFRQEKLLGKIIPTIEEILAAGGLDAPKSPEDAVTPAFPSPDSIGDAGHRS